MIIFHCLAMDYFIVSSLLKFTLKNGWIRSGFKILHYTGNCVTKETLIYGCFRAKKPINPSLFLAKAPIIQLIPKKLHFLLYKKLLIFFEICAII